MKNKMTDYHCPRCQNESIIEFEDSIHCHECDLDFDKDFLGVITDEDILSQQELGGVANSFTDEEKKKLLENEL